MTIVKVATIYCEGCAATESSLADGFECGQPVRWAAVEWEEAKGEKDRWKQVHACPAHLAMILKLLADEKARTVHQEAGHAY